MKPLKIFLADLTHQNVVLASENIPSNIGLLAAYAKKLFGDAVEFRLFKYPEKFIEALNETEPDIVGVSNYVWNSTLSEWANTKAKEKYPNVLTVKGGWTFPLDAEERLNFLLRNPATDLYLIHEAEESFAQVVEKCLEGNKDDIFVNPIAGSAFVSREGPTPQLIVGAEGTRMKELDEIPSPFVTGILDEFFDGKLFPVVETTRGCPFACNYCNSAEKYYSPVRRFSLDYVTKEL
jgi:radical SAM superfamily enzyme YgiQ (UPF0313 family)